MLVSKFSLSFSLFFFVEEKEALCFLFSRNFLGILDIRRKQIIHVSIYIDYIMPVTVFSIVQFLPNKYLCVPFLFTRFPERFLALHSLSLSHIDSIRGEQFKTNVKNPKGIG